MEKIIKTQPVYNAFKGKLPEELALYMGRMAFEPTPVAKIMKSGESGHCMDKSRYIYEMYVERVQIQIKLCMKCGNYVHHYMTQEEVSPKVLCTCINPWIDYFGEVLVELRFHQHTE